MMLAILISIPLLAPVTSLPGQIDSICREHCEVVAVQAGRVRFIDQWPPARNLDVGKYVPTAQRSVPRTEAPVLDLRSQHGWRIVASVYLDHKEDEPGTHIRFFGPDGALRSTQDVQLLLEQTKLGTLFGGADEIFAITSWEEHAYNTQTQIWLLPPSGPPKLLLDIPGIFQQFSDGAGRSPGVLVARETYDGVHAETKGKVQEFYVWDSGIESLKLQK